MISEEDERKVKVFLQDYMLMAHEVEKKFIDLLIAHNIHTQENIFQLLVDIGQRKDHNELKVIQEQLVSLIRKCEDKGIDTTSELKKRI